MRGGARSWRRRAGILIGAALITEVRAEPIESAALAEATTASSEEPSWIPALSFVGVGLVENRTASVISDERGSFSGSTRAVIGGFGGSVELSGAVLEVVPGRPRIFAHADASYLDDPDEPVINEGNPGPVKFLSQAATNQRPVAGAQGVGSATRVAAQPLMLSAGLGLSFGFTLFERNLRLKPSLEWQWHEDEVQLLFGDAESENPADPSRCDNVVGCRSLFLSSNRVQGFHALGPGLELEADAGRAGDFVFSVYASTQSYHVLGDRRVELTATGNWTRELDGLPSARAPSSVTSTFELERWQHRFGVGIRILWRPE